MTPTSGPYNASLDLNPSKAFEQARALIRACGDLEEYLRKTKLSDYDPAPFGAVFSRTQGVGGWGGGGGGGVQVLGLFRLLDQSVFTKKPKKKEILDRIAQFLERLSSFLEDAAPLQFSRSGIKFHNPSGFTGMSLEGLFDGLDLAVSLLKRRGISLKILSGMRGLIVANRDPQMDGSYHLTTQYIAIPINNRNVQRSEKRIAWVFVHELAHGLWWNLAVAARDHWVQSWRPVEDQQIPRGDDGSVSFSYSDRVMALMMIGVDGGLLLRKQSPLSLARIGGWLEQSGWGHYVLGDGLYVTKRLDKSTDLMTLAQEELDMSEGNIRVTVPKVLLQNHFKTEREAKDWLAKTYALPTEYAKTNKEEDFSESFAQFVLEPHKLNEAAIVRMKRVLWLSGWYGRPVSSAGSFRVVQDLTIPRKVLLRELHSLRDFALDAPVPDRLWDRTEDFLGDRFPKTRLSPEKMSKYLFDLYKDPEFESKRGELISLIHFWDGQIFNADTYSDDQVDKYLDKHQPLLKKAQEMIQSAQKRVHKWHGALKICRISPAIQADDRELWVEPTTVVGVSFDGDHIGFTLFFSDNLTLDGVDDVLEGGDRAMFDDQLQESDYFSLINEIRKPGSTSQGKWITLYTARPVKDRKDLEENGLLPAGIFLADDPRHVKGLAHDLSSRGVRDVWRVKLNTIDLIQTLSGGVSYYQLFGNRPVKPKSMALIEEGV